jgi:anaerobic ribonucleoside-triphosphate reductase activating protein
MLKINKILKRSLVNGPGIRYTIWFQGCSIHCKGCINPDTWDQTKGDAMEIAEIVKDINETPGIDGITLTGGEPLDQSEGLLKFLPQIFQNHSIFLISGYSRSHVLEQQKAVLANVDILCSEPFVEALVDPNLVWMGSSNQVLEGLTERGKIQLMQKRKYRTEIIIDKKDASLLATGFTIPAYLKKK